MNAVPGTQGYSDVASAFTRACESVDFYSIHDCIIDLIPERASRILDIGAGTGRDAAAFAKMGHNVVAVEPIHGFLETAKAIHPSDNVEWISDSLPNLESLGTRLFSFVLCHAVWQHLDSLERAQALKRIFELLLPRGIFALALRHGPPGVGVHYFPSNVDEALHTAATVGFSALRKLENQASVIPGKDDVTWTRLAFRKCTVDGGSNGA